MSENSGNGSGKVVGIIIIIVVVIAAGVGAWYFLSYKPEQEAKEKARLEEIAKKKAEKEKKAKAAQKKARYNKLIEDSDLAFSQENWETANSLYSDASTLYPNEQYPKDQLLLVQAKLDELSELEIPSEPGVVQTISSATDRYYIVISSSIDDDLAMDYANKLANDGNAVKIIEPYNDKKFYRVSLADYSTQQEADEAAGSFSEYGEGVWVLKY